MAQSLVCLSIAEGISNGDWSGRKTLRPNHELHDPHARSAVLPLGRGRPSVRGRKNKTGRSSFAQASRRDIALRDQSTAKGPLSQFFQMNGMAIYSWLACDASQSSNAFTISDISQSLSVTLPPAPCKNGTVSGRRKSKWRDSNDLVRVVALSDFGLAKVYVTIRKSMATSLSIRKLVRELRFASLCPGMCTDHSTKRLGR